jgi:hypothetical protein
MMYAAAGWLLCGQAERAGRWAKENRMVAYQATMR